MTTRRELLRNALGLVAAAAAQRAWASGKANKPLKILILGGTGFLGPHLVGIGRSRGHTITLFNRGKTRADLFPDVEKLRGDRKGNLKSLEGRSWDAVIDNTGYVPKWVKLSAELLAPRVQQYVFVSSISVYPDDVKPDADESTPVQPLREPDTEEVMKHYGALKAACERTVEAALPGRATKIRPGLIVGPEDRSDRFTYWVTRMARGGEVLAPVGPHNPVQVIDVRDLTAWMIRCVEERITGVFNATGEKETLGNMLAACARATGGDAKVTYAAEDFLREQKVGHWDDLKDWQSKEEAGLWQVDSSKARKAGLRHRSLEDTARATWAWWNTLPEERRKKMRSGLPPEREAAILAAWKAKKG